MDSSGCIRSDQIRPELLKEVLLSNLSTLRFNLLERINIAVYSAFIGDKSGTLDKSYRIINTDVMNIQKNRRAVDSRHLSTKMEPNCERARKCSAVRPGGSSTTVCYSSFWASTKMTRTTTSTSTSTLVLYRAKGGHFVHLKAFSHLLLLLLLIIIIIANDWGWLPTKKQTNNKKRRSFQAGCSHEHSRRRVFTLGTPSWAQKLKK